jgi:hypothetical protein
MRHFTIIAEYGTGEQRHFTVDTTDADWDVYETETGAADLARDLWVQMTETDETGYDGTVYVWEGENPDTTIPATASHDRNSVSTWYVNLTPHEVTLIHESAEPSRFEPSGTVARVAESAREGDDGNMIVTLGEIEGLPGPRSGRVYIVSMPLIMALAAKGIHRKDVVYPYQQVRDGSGRIVGSRRLARLG